MHKFSSGALSKGVEASDVIRSMTRAGFSREEIYDVLAGVGLPGEQLQLLMDRVAADFHEANLEPRPSRLAIEVERIFRSSIDDVRHDLLARTDSLARQLELVKLEMEKINRLIFVRSRVRK